jgi:hypothetical protein
VHKLRSGAVVMLALASTGCLGSVHNSAGTASLNEEVRDGNFAFTVTAVNIGVPKTGYQTAQGIFVVFQIMVKNLGDAPRTVYCQDQRLRDQAGKTYDNAVSIVGRAGEANIGPGKEVHVTCAFDVPKGTLPAAIVVHASPYSRGATVTVLGQSR